uniref:Angiopoietin-4 n=1 Tax=Magallana gigas TaxID=29159 RepID=K1PRF3_MAGGI
MVMKKLEEVDKISDLIYKTQTEQCLLKQEMKSFTSKADTLLNNTVTDCADILNNCTRGKDGVYTIIDSKAVFCDMTTDNGGWTVVQRRVNGSVDFYRNWTEYKNGFGFADHEYWIGNDMLHRLTSLKTQELRVDMERFNGEKAYAVYSRFSVGDETSKYKLAVQGYSGNAGNYTVQ